MASEHFGLWKSFGTIKFIRSFHRFHDALIHHQKGPRRFENFILVNSFVKALKFLEIWQW